MTEVCKDWRAQKKYRLRRYLSADWKAQDTYALIEECFTLRCLSDSLAARLKDLERNRAWCADILEKELNCRCATITSVYHALKAEPLRTPPKKEQ